MVKNPLADKGDAGSFSPWPREIPNAEASKSASQPFSLCSRAWELQLLRPPSPRAHAAQRVTPPQWEAHTLQVKSSHCLLQLEKSPTQQQRPSVAKNKKKNLKKNTLNEMIANQKVKRLVILRTEQEILSKLKQVEKKKKGREHQLAVGHYQEA